MRRLTYLAILAALLSIGAQVQCDRCITDTSCSEKCRPAGPECTGDPTLDCGGCVRCAGYTGGRWYRADKPCATPTPEPSPDPTATPVPTASPTADPVTPTPGATSVPPTPTAPLLEKWKVSNTCHATEDDGDHVWCQKDSTQIYPDGPCDRDHPIAWNGACGQRTWDDLRGPHWSTSPPLAWRWHSSHARWFRAQKGTSVEFTTCPRADVGAPVDHLRYESGGYDDIINDPGAEAAREAVPRISIPVKGSGCWSERQVF